MKRVKEDALQTFPAKLKSSDIPVLWITDQQDVVENDG